MDMESFTLKERERSARNKIKNRPIRLMTYIMIVVFIGMCANIIYFVVVDSETVVANSANQRQDSKSRYVKRGDIITSDGVVVATTDYDEEGNEYRYYPYGDLYAHTVGYDSYGKAGLELSQNYDLLDSHASFPDKVKNDLKGEKNPGDSVVTTLDSNLQTAAANALYGCNGAVVVMDASTGDILAMYSNPTFDPNEMDYVWDSVHSEEGESSTVLLNRATQGLYAPGSTFKVITAMEYMMEHPDYEDYDYYCEGEDVFNSVSIRCSDSTVHGELGLSGSLAYSCNTSFANIGINEIDMDSLRDFTEKLLFNEKLPFSGDYNESVFVMDGKSDKSLIAQTVIGQADTLVTPLHNAMIMQTIANGGVMMKPQLVSCIKDADGNVISETKPKAYNTIISTDIVKGIIPMLHEVCLSGTAARFMADKPYSVAGKTGTAEYDNNGNCNSWFVGFSNIDDPDIVVSVIVEDYTTNQTSGTYVASMIMDAYYSNNQ